MLSKVTIPTFYSIDMPLPSCNIYIYRLGEEDVGAGRSCGPVIRKNTIFHYIYDGCGIFKINGKIYHLEAGQIFVLLPNTPVYFEADKENPWKYKMLEVNGPDMTIILAHLGLHVDNPVFSDTTEKICGRLLLDMIRRVKSDTSFLALNAALWQFLAAVSECMKYTPKAEPQQLIYVKKALDYIHTNYAQLPYVNEIATHLGLDRSYLNKLFHTYVGLSPQTYILKHRIETAKTLLLLPEYTVEDIGKSVGYEDVHAFSKAFKKQTGMSPGAWRKSGLYL
ncbi:MAG: AraC family transcriptional regulator [Ruminococcaceae bacterium]|nr:AraC family transcriptional regulator [Oscillospiraceae bacterium]